MLIGIVCPECSEFTSKIYKTETYKQKLEEYKEEFVVKQVVAKLDGGHQIPQYQSPLPNFYCETCGVIIETTAFEPEGRAAITKIDKWLDRFE